MNFRIASFVWRIDYKKGKSFNSHLHLSDKILKNIN